VGQQSLKNNRIVSFWLTVRVCSMNVRSKGCTRGQHSYIGLCHTVTQWTYWKKHEKNNLKMNKNEAYPTAVYPCIPATPWYGYAVCCGVSKFTTVPVPAKPVTPNPRVFPNPWPTLTLTLSSSTFQIPLALIRIIYSLRYSNWIQRSCDWFL